MTRSPAFRRRLAAGFASLAVTAHFLSGLALAGNSPQGDTAAGWPSNGGWTAYAFSDGNPVIAAEDNVNPSQVDIASNGGTAASAYAASKGGDVFFRLRLNGDPRDDSKGGFDNAVWLVQIATANDGTVRAVVGLNGKPVSTDFVYVSNRPGSTVTQIYTTPFDTSGGQDSRGARGLSDGNGQFFLDFQVPMSRITAVSGGAIMASTPVKFFFGTSTANNLATVNKDYMTGSSVSFTNLAPWTLADGPIDDPADEDPADDDPADEDPSDDPADDDPADQDPADDDPADDDPSDDPADDDPADQDPADDDPADEDPSDDPADQDPADDDPADEDPDNEDPGKDDPGNEDPGNDDPGNQDPGNDDPADHDPADNDPADNDPTDQDPADQDPADEDPGNDDPGNDDPGNDDPGNEDPGNEDPSDDPADQDLADDDPADQDPADDDSSDDPADDDTTNDTNVSTTAVDSSSDDEEHPAPVAMHGPDLPNACAAGCESVTTSSVAHTSGTTEGGDAAGSDGQALVWWALLIAGGVLFLILLAARRRRSEETSEETTELAYA